MDIIITISEIITPARWWTLLWRWRWRFVPATNADLFHGWAPRTQKSLSSPPPSNEIPELSTLSWNRLEHSFSSVVYYQGISASFVCVFSSFNIISFQSSSAIKWCVTYTMNQSSFVIWWLTLSYQESARNRSRRPHQKPSLSLV